MGLTQEQDRNRQFETQLLERLSATQGAAEEYMASLYRMVASSPFSRQQYARFLQLLLQQEKGAVLWHCSAGKDRVGVGTALVLAALGVSRKTVMEDYLATARFTAPQTQEALRKLRKGGGSEQALQSLQVLMGVREQYLSAVFAVWEQEFGSMDGFFEAEMGLGAPERERLGQLYLE